MRSLGLVMIIVFGTWTTARGAPAKTPLLSMHLRGHYGSQQTEVYLEKKVYHCKTELTPYHECRTKPFSSDSIASIQKSHPASASALNCRDTITVTTFQKGAERKYTGCLTDPAFARLTRELDRNCGRNM